VGIAMAQLTGRQSSKTGQDQFLKNQSVKFKKIKKIQKK
jgi:hypothetical protein